MSDKFIKAMEKSRKDEKVLTENGAVAFKTSGEHLVDINFRATDLRTMGKAKIENMFSKAWQDDETYALRWAFYLRDVRGGLGERESFRTILSWLGDSHPDIAKNLIPHIAEYGRFDDLFSLHGTLVWKNVLDYMKDVLMKDIEGKDSDGEKWHPTLLAKWLPSINASSHSKNTLAKEIARHLGFTDRKYRKVLSTIRSRLRIVEKDMSSGKWGEIQYQAVPSKANLLYKDAFLKHDKERREAYIESLKKGEAKINSSTATPVDIVYKYMGNRHEVPEKDDVIEAMWKSLPDVGFEKDMICVVDVSGSMTWTTFPGSGCRPLDAALGLGIYTAQRNRSKAFKNKMITFSRDPRYIDIFGLNSLRNCLVETISAGVGMNTDVEKVMDLILQTAKKNDLEQKDIPDVIILSDMQFDEASSGSKRMQETLWENISNQYREAGYSLPRMIYWNLNGGPVPMQKNKNGLVLMGGFSQNALKMVLSGKLDPLEVLKDTLDAERYAVIDGWSHERA